MKFTLFKKKESPLQKKETDKSLYIILSFVIPFVLMFLYYAIENFSGFNKIVPDFAYDILRKIGFSISRDEQQILVIDMWHQYFPFFKEMNEALKSGGSLLYQWNNGLGTTFLPIIAYYCASPLNILSVLFPSDFLVEGMAILVITKISLASTFMFVYLKNTFGKNDMGTLLFAVMYGMCSFNMGYSWCTMWLDVVMLLPLCILGFDRLVSEGKFLLYSISLGLIMYSNYYIGFMVCVFIVCYYPVVYFSRSGKRGAKQFFSTTAEVIAFSALGCGLAAFMIVPTFLAMQNNSYMGKDFTAELSTYQSFIETLGNLLPGVDVTYRNGLPNIYCGFLTAVLGVTYFVNRKISTKEKLLKGALLAFLLVSFNWNILNFIWHGLHFPNELPYRFSFLFSFVLITIAYKSFINIKGVSKKGLTGVAAGIAGFILLLEVIESETFEYGVIYIALTLLVIYTLCLYAYKKGKLKAWGSKLVLVVIALCEVAAVSCRSIAQVGSSSRNGYISTYDDIQNLLATAKSESSGFYRVEKSDCWTVNDPALYSYTGVSEFSSVINSNLSDFVRSLGVNAEKGANSIVYNQATPVINALFNIKYLIGNNSEIVPDSHLTYITESNGSTLYENKYPLSLGFMVKDSIYDYHAGNGLTRAEAQEKLVNLATGLDLTLFEELDDPTVSSSNIVATYDGAGKISCSNPTDSKQPSKVSLEYVSDKDQDIYFGIAVTGLSSFSVSIGDGDEFSYPSQGRSAIVAGGYAKKGETIYIDITIDAGKTGSIQSRIYGFNEDAWQKAYAKLSQNMMTVTEYTDRTVSGTVTADEDGVLLTSIPYDKGWSVKVDGEKVDIKALDNALCAIPLTAGEHTIEFSFFTYGLSVGIIASLCCAGMLVLIAVISRKKKPEESIRNSDENPEKDKNEFDIVEQTDIGAEQSQTDKATDITANIQNSDSGVTVENPDDTTKTVEDTHSETNNI